MFTVNQLDNNKVQVQLGQIVPSLRDKLRQEVSKLGYDLQAHIVKDYLNGQALNRKTGKLANSINVVNRNSDNEIVSIVGANMSKAKYAAFWEYGFSGAVSVKQHLRTITQAFGREIAPETINVSAHSRNINQAARPFIHPALNDMRSEIVQRITAAVKK